MKKLAVILTLLLITTFALAIDEPSTIETDKEKIEGAIEVIPINPDTGELDPTRLDPIKTKADERIEKINLWLEENASWLKVVFGMVPSVTWLFAINFYILLVFIVSLILNGHVTLAWLPLSKKIDLGLFQWTWANIVGLAIFLILHITKAITNIAIFFHSLFVHALKEMFLLEALTAIIAVVILIFGSRLLDTIQVKLEEKRKARAQAKQEENQEVLEKIVQPITKA